MAPLSMIPSPPPSGGVSLAPVTPTERINDDSSQKQTTQNSSSTMGRQYEVDFVGSSTAVKDLFSLPYTSQDQAVSVAIHNVEGTLIFDRDPNPSSPQPPKKAKLVFSNRNKKRPLPFKEPRPKEEEPPTSSSQDVSQALVALSSLEPPGPSNLPNTNNDALTVVNSFLEAVETQKRRAPHASSEQQQNKREDTADGDGHDKRQALGLPRPEDYVHQHIPPTPEPREYLSWKFHDMNLWVGSDALILRSESDGKKETKQGQSVALTVRVEEARELQALVQRHETSVQSGSFEPDHQLSFLQQQGKPSYAKALLGSSEGADGIAPSSAAPETSGSVFSAPDLDEVKLQTCIVPSPATPVGGLLDTDTSRTLPINPSEVSSSAERAASMVSPVSTVLDAYLDNIMANVPQLALCLREKGFIQSVKLLETDRIPTAFLHPSTADTSRPFGVATEESERIFSPQVMEMNATALLRFLKCNCSKDNATYLLRREVGQTNIQLYDISSISAQKQRKWIWWLAMMSCRFAHRLRNISIHTPDISKRRQFRNRERALLQNALDLLEVLADMDGTTHESLAAGVRENLADTFLRGEEDGGAAMVPKDSSTTGAGTPTASHEPATAKSSSQQPYATLTVDALNKAHDHLASAIKCLFTHLEKLVTREETERSDESPLRVVSIDGSSSDESDDEREEKEADHTNNLEVIATATQLFGLHEKIVNVSLRLAETHLRNFFSSSAMQSLRTAARRIADSLYILTVLAQAESNAERDKEWLRHVQLQYVWLWEHCGHFARSFAAENSLWRERGHAAADDILIVLQDAESAFAGHDHLDTESALGDQLRLFLKPIAAKDESINLQSLSGIVGKTGVQEAKGILQGQKFLLLEERKVIVASCIAYQRAIQAFEQLDTTGSSVCVETGSTDSTFLAILQQRLGDACNEAGKILLNELRVQLSLPPNPRTTTLSSAAAGALLTSAEFWFAEGLDAFEKSGDLRNLVLLRCNLCQCYKLRANSMFSPEDSTKQSDHAEGCLQEAANQLEAAHESLGERGAESTLWDMVSAELAATFLVLGVRRRQSLIGSGNTPMILQSLRLSPGQERSIVEPMERALGIYQESGNLHQAAAAHYQLALFYSKVWTCQRDETKTREKLAAAFKHYCAAHSYFTQAVRGNELTLCLVCMDLSNLYSSVQGEEGNAKALFCCLDTIKAFGTAMEPTSTTSRSDDWFLQMDTVAKSVEDRLFKLLRGLVKLFDDGETKIPYKDIYRASLTAKMTVPKPKATEKHGQVWERLAAVHDILKATDGALSRLGLR